MWDTKIKNLRNAIERSEKELEFEDLCEVYEFDKIGDKERFNSTFNDPYLKRLLKIDRTRDFFNDIDRQIRRQSNDVFMIYGPKGMGKSNILMKLMKYWQKRYNEIKRKKVNKFGLIKYVGFSDSQFRSIIRIVKEGDILGRDESPIASGSGIRTDANALQNFINQTREYQTSSIFVNPRKVENISGIDYYMEVAGKKGVYFCENCGVEYLNRMICPSCKIETYVVYNKSETRCIWYDREGFIIGAIYLPLHTDQKFRTEYHEKKISNLKSTVIHGGEVHSQYNKKQYIDDLIKLYDFCIECEANSLADVKTHLINYNLSFDPFKEPEKLVVGNIDYINNVVRNVFNAIKGNIRGNPLKEYIDSKQGDDYREETYLNDQEREKILSQIRTEVQDEAKENEFSMFLTQYYYKLLPKMVKVNQKNSIEKDTILEILDLWASRTGIRDISHSVKVHQGIVNDILILFKEGKRDNNTILDDWRLYKMYEYWCAHKFNLKIISGHRKPDWTIKIDQNSIIPGECKLFDNVKNSIRIHKEQKLHSYKHFQEDLNYIPVLVRNVKWGNYDFLFKVPINDDPYFTFIKDSDQMIETLDLNLFKDIVKKKGFSYEGV